MKLETDGLHQLKGLPLAKCDIQAKESNPIGRATAARIPGTKRKRSKALLRAETSILASEEVSDVPSKGQPTLTHRDANRRRLHQRIDQHIVLVTECQVRLDKILRYKPSGPICAEKFCRPGDADIRGDTCP